MEKFIHVDRCDSTQDLLKEQLTTTGNSDLTISCEHQTNGRGRGINLWQDSPGTLCFSMAIQPHKLTTFTALELSCLVADFFALKGQEIKLKWPNDLIKSNKKCGGILIQQYENHFLAGIGLNLYQSQDAYSGVYEAPFELEKKIWSQELSNFIRSHRYSSTEELIRKWNLHCDHMNQMVKVTEGENETRGVFKGLGHHGEALLDTPEGIQHLFNGSLRLV